MESRETEFTLLVKKALPLAIEILEKSSAKQKNVEIASGIGLGEKGLFVQVHNKYARLRSCIWDSANIEDIDFAIDSALDISNYALALAGLLMSKKDE